MLLNQMHERFAQGRAMGMTWRGAYRYAGYRGDSGHASRLARRPDVLLRTRQLINDNNALVSLTEGVLVAKVVQVEDDVRSGHCGPREAEARLRALALAYRIKTEAHRRNQAIVSAVRAATQASIWDEAGEPGTPMLPTELSEMEAEEEAMRLELSGLAGPRAAQPGPDPVQPGPDPVPNGPAPVRDSAAFPTSESEPEWEDLEPFPDPDAPGLNPTPLYADRPVPQPRVPEPAEPDDPQATLQMAQAIVARQLAEAAARTEDPTPIRTPRPEPPHSTDSLPRPTPEEGSQVRPEDRVDGLPVAV